MHGIVGWGVGQQRKWFLKGTKWDDMCNDRLQSLIFSFSCLHPWFEARFLSFDCFLFLFFTSAFAVASTG